MFDQSPWGRGSEQDGQLVRLESHREPPPGIKNRRPRTGMKTLAGVRLEFLEMECGSR